MSRIHGTTFILMLLTPALAAASDGTIELAGNGPWVALAVIGAVRALLGFASSSPQGTEW